MNPVNTVNLTRRRADRVAAVALVFGGLIVAACGDDTASSDATVAPTTTKASASSDESPADGAGASAAPDTTAGDDARDDAMNADAFPVTIEHKYGETTIASEPERVVSVGFAEHDGLLALGVIPVGVRDWYGEHTYATWPWALDALGDAEPEVIAAAALNFEQIAALQPDLIIGVSSGMTDDEYATLSAIAPTVAQPGEYPDYGTPLQEQFMIAARAVGRTAQAEEVLADLDAKFAAARAAHPEFAGATAAVAFTFEELPGAYSSGDNRSEVLRDLGFVIPPEFDELAGDAFWFSVSPEELAVLDQDVIVWIVSDPTGYQSVVDEPLRPTLRAYAEGREVVADPLLSGAFSHASPLSLDYVLEHLVDELAAAVDGDPSTPVPSASLLDDVGPAQDVDADGDASGAAVSDDELVAAEAWAVVFDSTTSFADKAPYLEDAEALRVTIESYETAGEAMGGISLDPTAVAIAGDVAAVTYDVLFGGTAAYTSLDGELTLVEGTWTVSRDEFCGFMAQARNAC